MKPLPNLASELVGELDKAYPECSPDPSDSERKIWMKAGQRKLVRTLLHRMRHFKDSEMEQHLKGGQNNVYEFKPHH